MDEPLVLQTLGGSRLVRALGGTRRQVPGSALDMGWTWRSATQVKGYKELYCAPARGRGGRPYSPLDSRAWALEFTGHSFTMGHFVSLEVRSNSQPSQFACGPSGYQFKADHPPEGDAL